MASKKVRIEASKHMIKDRPAKWSDEGSPEGRELASLYENGVLTKAMKGTEHSTILHIRLNPVNSYIPFHSNIRPGEGCL
jgi:hypothetical protein